MEREEAVVGLASFLAADIEESLDGRTSRSICVGDACVECREARRFLVLNAARNERRGVCRCWEKKSERENDGDSHAHTIYRKPRDLQ